MKKDKNILVITYWSFDNALIQTYTLPYVKQIRQFTGNGRIYLFTLSQNKKKVDRHSEQIKELEAQNIFILDFTYQKFGPGMLIKMLLIMKYLVLFCWFKRIAAIHAWCTPGGAIGWLVSLFSFRPLVLDSFEPHAETMVEGGTWSKNGMAYRLLSRVEKWQLRRARHVICAAPGMIRHSQDFYGITKQQYFVKPACVNLELFSRNTKLKKQLELKHNVCVYAGKFGGIYLEREVFDFFKVCHDYWKGDFTVLLLTSHTDSEIENYCRLSGFPGTALVKKFVPHAEVPDYMSLGTFGFCPVKPLPSKQFCTPIKNGEYWAMGLPVVITRNISGDSDLIEKENIGHVLKAETHEEYLKAVMKIAVLCSEKNLASRIRLVAERERNFKDSLEIYRAIYA